MFENYIFILYISFTISQLFACEKNQYSLTTYSLHCKMNSEFMMKNSVRNASLVECCKCVII